MEEDPVVSEAVRRLPQEEQDLRLFRLKRALDLSLKKALLPKDQWTSDEEVDMYIHACMYTHVHTCTCTYTCTCSSLKLHVQM